VRSSGHLNSRATVLTGHIDAREAHSVDQTLLPVDNLRLPTYGGLYAWELERCGRKLNVRVDGQFVFNTVAPIVAAALDGAGLAILPEDEVLAQIEAGQLVRVPDDGCPPFPGYHRDDSSRRQSSPAFVLVVEALGPSSEVATPYEIAGTN
jgi:DNA-binding transcriptional LysR family regulator